MKKNALLIAINAYPPDSGLAPLKYAEADARDLAATLRQTCGFHTTLLCGAQATRDAVEQAVVGCGSGDTFLFFFAGHGQLVKGQYHLHPVDSRASGLRAIPFEFFAREWRNDFGYEKVLAVIDACRNEAVGLRGSRGFSSADSRDIVTATQGRRWVEVLYGCSEGQVSYEPDELGHGVLTHALLRALREKREYLDADILAGATADYMEDWSRTDQKRRWQVAHRYHVPSLKRKLTLFGDAPADLKSAAREKCPLCGRRNAAADTFECRRCGRDYLCNEHFVQADRCCEECAEQLARDRVEAERQAKKEAARQAELQRQKEARRQAETERQRQEEEMWRQREEAERRKNPANATKECPWENSLEMKFVPVSNTKVLFCIWETRVQDFEAFVRATGHDTGQERDVWDGEQWLKTKGNWSEPGFSQGPTCPVTCVSWEDAQAFCRWLTKKEQSEGLLSRGQSYRLPSDAEWSWAVGIGDREGPGTPREKDQKVKGVYPWGTAWPPPPGAGNYCDETCHGTYKKWDYVEDYDDGYVHTSPVGSFAANPYGLYDMGGNVWEWCEDYYDGKSGSRVLRGGSWKSLGPGSLLSSDRISYSPANRNGNVGFRCVLVASSR